MPAGWLGTLPTPRFSYSLSKHVLTHPRVLGVARAWGTGEGAQTQPAFRCWWAGGHLVLQKPSTAAGGGRERAGLDCEPKLDAPVCFSLCHIACCLQWAPVPEDALLALTAILGSFWTCCHQSARWEGGHAPFRSRLCVGCPELARGPAYPHLRGEVPSSALVPVCSLGPERDRGVCCVCVCVCGHMYLCTHTRGHVLAHSRCVTSRIICAVSKSSLTLCPEKARKFPPRRPSRSG